MTKRQIAISAGLGLSVLCVFCVLGYLVVDKVSITSDGVSISLAITPGPATTPTPTVAKRPWVATPKPTATPTPEIPSWPTPTTSQVGYPQHVETINYVLNYVPHPEDGLTIGQRMTIFWWYYQDRGYDMQRKRGDEEDWTCTEWRVFGKEGGSNNLLVVFWNFYMNGERTTVDWWVNRDTGRVGPDNSLARFIYD